MNYIKSPIFYMGNKYELLPQLMQIFPKNINTFYDVFGGSGVVSLNVKANNVVYNEINHNVHKLLKIFKEYTSDEIIGHIENRIKEFELPNEINDNRGQKKYLDFRNFYNNSKDNILDLYALTYFSFCNLMRFNSKSEFNMPYGNRCYSNKKHKQKIKNACNLFKRKNIHFLDKDAFDLLNKTTFQENDFVYCDPPYLNTEAIYNEKRAFGGWTIEHDYELFEELDKLDSKGVKWCLSNVKENKGNTNQHLIDWANEKGYRIIGMSKNYSALGKGSANTYEICVINYETNLEGFKIIQERLF